MVPSPASHPGIGIHGAATTGNRTSADESAMAFLAWNARPNYQNSARSREEAKKGSVSGSMKWVADGFRLAAHPRPREDSGSYSTPGTQHTS